MTHQRHKERSVGRPHQWQERVPFIRYWTHDASLVRHTQFEWELGPLFNWKKRG
jgi:hypothetical protein